MPGPESRPDERFDLLLQELPRQDRILALAWFVMQRESDGWFRTTNVAELNQGLRLPDLGNISQSLAAFRTRGLVIDRRQGSKTQFWTLTPSGQTKATALVGRRSIGVDPYTNSHFTADFLDISFPTLPAGLAPSDLASRIQPFLEEYPFETNVFLMTRFPTKEAADPIADVIDVARHAVSEHGLVLHVAFDRAIHDEVWPNIAAHMWASKYGLGVLETTLATSVDTTQPLNERLLKAVTLNDNVLLELGSMLTLGRRCKILKDVNAPQPPSDLLSQIYRTVDLTDLESVSEAIHLWITEDLLIR